MEDNELKTLLRKNIQLSEENHRMLRSLKRSNFISGIFKLLWIALLIGIPLYLYFEVLSPVIGRVNETAQKVEGYSAGFEAQFPWLKEIIDDVRGRGEGGAGEGE